MSFAAAVSEHPLPTHAVGEVVGEVLEQIGSGPDLAVLFVTAPHVGAIDDIAEVVRTALAPGTLLAATAASLVGGAREIEEHAAVSLWAGRLGPVTPVRLEARQVSSMDDPASGGQAWAVTGLPPEADGRTLLLLADPFSFPADGFLAELARATSGPTVIGGLASAARGPGGNRLLLDGASYRDGAVGALLPAGADVVPVVSQGCRPIGEPFVVTRAERNVIQELGGQPALDRLKELVAELDPEERTLVQAGLHVGVVIDERRDEFERGDFLIRNVVGADSSAGALAVGDVVEVGTTVQFQVRDAAAADEDLRELLAGRDADAALVFTCNGRGSHLFGQADHDAQLVSRATDGGPTAGMFCAGELGPVGGRSFLHGFTASIALFRD